jgi:predicted RNA binding protein YcfA (HicA-like mRNA interferase family)
MPAIPILKPKEVIKAFQMLGWNPEVVRGTLRALIARAGLTVDEFLEALES